MSDPDRSPGTEKSSVDLEALRSRLEDLEGTVDAPHERAEVQRTIRLVDRIPSTAVGERIRKFTRRDIAEAFVGSTLISLPMLVEDGVFDIADHFVGMPLFFGLNAVLVVVVTAGMLYYAEFRNVSVHRPILGIVPRRLFAVLVVSFVTATFAMTLWGRLGGWSDPAVALGRISVVWTAASFGAALGDILPGESTGTDINDEIDALGERFGIGDDEGRF